MATVDAVIDRDLTERERQLARYEARLRERGWLSDRADHGGAGEELDPWGRLALERVCDHDRRLRRIAAVLRDRGPARHQPVRSSGRIHGTPIASKNDSSVGVAIGVPVVR